MAARINKTTHEDKTKRLIQASQLLNRLNSFANGEIELSQAQVNAARVVINKSIPDINRIEGPAEDGAHVMRIIHETA